MTVVINNSSRVNVSMSGNYGCSIIFKIAATISIKMSAYFNYAIIAKIICVVIYASCNVKIAVITKIATMSSVKVSANIINTEIININFIVDI